MSRTRYTFIKDDTNPYFITATAINWLPLFSDPDIVAIILDSLRFLIENERFSLHAYVVMENHLHLIVSGIDIAREVKNFKSFTAHKCVQFWQERNYFFILDQLADLKLNHKKDRTFQFWQEGSHPQRIIDESMMQQKIDYIHHNPVKRGYVDSPEHWRYSSARDYSGREGLLPVLLDW
jgi:putative transposase